MAVDADDVRRLALSLPRSTRHFVRDSERFKAGRLVYLTFDTDELVGLAFPRELREAAVAAEPHKFVMPRSSDLRYQWIVVRLAALDLDEMTELVTEAWAMCVPKSVSEPWFDAHP